MELNLSYEEPSQASAAKRKRSEPPAGGASSLANLCRASAGPLPVPPCGQEPSVLCVYNNVTRHASPPPSRQSLCANN